MLDVYKVKKYIIDNDEYIQLLLEESGFCKISDRGKEYRCAYDIDTNSTSIKVSKDNLSSFDFSRGIKGDLITLIQHKIQKSFPRTLKFICSIVGLNDDNLEKEEVKLPFDGFFRNIGKNKDTYEKIKTYNDNILEQYSRMPNRLFLKDGIPVDIQMKYEIGYDVMSGRITIPHRNTIGELVGIVGRCNTSEIEEGVAKYYPIIPFKKSKVLFGYDKNYKYIQKKQMVILAESEKSVMKMDAMGLKNCLAVGGNYVSEIQSKNIQALMPKYVIIGFDEGIEEEHLRNQAKKVKLENPFLNINVGYIYDKNNEIMKKDSKIAPMDLPKNLLEKLMRNYTVWI